MFSRGRGIVGRYCVPLGAGDKCPVTDERSGFIGVMKMTYNVAINRRATTTDETTE